jgi:hypothetical protein
MLSKVARTTSGTSANGERWAALASQSAVTQAVFHAVLGVHAEVDWVAEHKLIL